MDTLRDLHLAVYNRPNHPAYNTLYLRFNAATRDVLRIREWTNNLEDQ